MIFKRYVFICKYKQKVKYSITIQTKVILVKKLLFSIFLQLFFSQ